MPLFNPDTGATVLSGHRPPHNDHLFEVDDVNSPWRWSPTLRAWVGPPYAVSWVTADEIPPFTAPAEASRLILYVGAWTPDALEDAITATTDFNAMQSYTAASDLGVATTTDSGVAFLIQYEPVLNNAPTAVPSVVPDVATMLGDLTVDGTFTFPPEDVTGDGEEGDYWLDLAPQNLYGPKTGGIWTVGGTARFLSGTAAPVSGPGIEPLDGINNPWRWHPARSSWVGPAYQVSWVEDEHTAELLTPPGTTGAALFISTETTLGPALSQTEGVLWSIINPTTGLPTNPTGSGSNFGFGPPSADDERLVAVGNDSGIAFIEQYEADFGGPTTVPVPDLDVIDYLGDMAASATPYEWPETTGDGSDGDYFRDTVTGNIYGPKTNGIWGPVIGQLFDRDVPQTVTKAWHFFTDDPTLPPISLSGGTEPADIEVDTGNVCIWYDDATGTPSVNFKGKDDAGTVFTATIPLT